MIRTLILSVALFSLFAPVVLRGEEARSAESRILETLRLG